VTLRVALSALIAIPSALSAQALLPPSTGGAAALAQELRFLGHNKRVLLIAAHPDDEDTELLTVLARGMGAEAAYLSLNRGEGGQNLIGDELGEGLGVVRTGELLAARRLDGARQFFTRAYDFGFSKNLADTWAHWPRDSVLKDVVRVIRQFQPQVVVSIFSGTPRDGHGQHQAAGWAAQEAFRVAGDASRFPELEREEGIKPWQPLKLFRSTRFDSAGTTLALAGGALDEAVGQSYYQIAMRGRSLHRSQDMGQLQRPGPSQVRLRLLEDRTGRGGQSLFSGIDTTVTSGDPAAADLAVHQARIDVMRMGVQLDAVVGDGSLVPGQSDTVTLTVWNTSDSALRFEADLIADWRKGGQAGHVAGLARPGEVTKLQLPFQVPADHRPSQPYFLRSPRDGDLYRWDNGERSVPFEPPVLAVRFNLWRGGRPVTIEREVAYRVNDQARGEVREPVFVVPRIDVQLDPRSGILRAGDTTAQRFSVTLVHHAPEPSEGQVSLQLPEGWPAVPPQHFRMVRDHERQVFQFRVRPGPQASGSFTLAAVAEAGGQADSVGTTLIAYPHIRSRRIVRPAVASVRIAPLALPPLRRIAYVRGAADRVPEALLQVGIPLTLITGREIETRDVSGYQAIIIGPRAFETDPDLPAANDQLIRYAERGGLVITQYQQYSYFLSSMAPYGLTVGGRTPGTTAVTALSRDSTRGSAPPTTGVVTTALLGGHDRVTDENAAVTVVDPASPLLRSPNRIIASDWDGWVQERGLYFARSWSEEWKPVLSMHDPGDQPLEGGLLVSRVGKGTYVYTGLSFFRQLPAGVPGAFRLFANLLALATPVLR
jgi:LmbE family N-acetylglucosaminyl deacetylase